MVRPVPRREIPRIVACLFTVLVLTTPAVAGQDTSASIVGQVKDESGAILPGVTVTATSPALQVASVTAVTDEHGEYRLTPLPIGTYQVEYTLTGFQTVRHPNIRLTANFVAKLDVVMKVGALEETITVSGVSPVVDVTATSTATQLTRETLELTPTSNYGYVSLMTQAPGARTNVIDVGGSAIEPGGGGVFSFRVFGQANESWQTIEGIVTNSSKASQGGNVLDYGAVEEARIETVGANANMRSPGVSLSAIVKSGSNAFHGTALWTQTGKSLESDNLDDTMAAQGLTGHHLLKRALVSGDIGGRIIRDKLWFYAGGSFRTDKYELLNVFLPDGSVAPNYKDLTFFTTKVSYQLSPKNRLIGFIQPSYFEGYVSTLNRFNGWETRVLQTCDGPHCMSGTPGKLEWQTVLSDTLMFSAQIGHWNWNSLKVSPELKPATTDLFTQINTGSDWTRHPDHANEYNHQATGSLTRYRRDLWGNHEFKTGFDYLDQTLASDRDTRGAALNYQLVFNSGVPFELNTNNFPLNASQSLHYTGIYGQDKWTLGRRVTLALGLRYAHDNGFVPEQCRPSGDFSPATCFAKTQFKIWNALAPRIQAALDLTGDGKTVIKGGWARFDHERRLDPEVIAANQNISTNTTWLWHDNNGNKLYEPGEVNLDPNGSDFVGIGSLGSTASGTSFAVANQNEKEPMQDQYSASVERQLIQTLAVRGTAMYVHSFNNYRTQNNFRPYDSYNIPVTRPDPGPDGRAGTADDPGVSFTYYEYPASLQGAQFIQGMLINPPGMDASYTSFEFAASKRLSNKWSLMASYSATKRDVPIQADGGAPPDFNPNAEINTADKTWEWLTRISGSYFLPWDIVLSANFSNTSGAPWARTVLFTGGRTIPSITLNVEPLGSHRYDSVNLLDVRAEKRLRIKGGQQIAFRANVFNTLNSNTVTAATTRSGASFGIPTAFLAARVLELGVSFSY
jgi:hypothetical protein